MQVRPHIAIVVKNLLLFVSELVEESWSLMKAKRSLEDKFKWGLPAIYYGNLTYLLAMCQSGTRVQLCIVTSQRQGEPIAVCLYQLCCRRIEPQSLLIECFHASFPGQCPCLLKA